MPDRQFRPLSTRLNSVFNKARKEVPSHAFTRGFGPFGPERRVKYDLLPMVDSQAIFEFMRRFVEDRDREHLWAACLDTRSQLTCLNEVSIGSLKRREPLRREVFKVALLGKRGRYNLDPQSSQWKSYPER